MIGCQFLWHVIRPGRLKIGTSTSESIRRRQSRRTMIGRRFLLGFCFAFRQFMSSFANISPFLNRKLFKYQLTRYRRLKYEELGAMKMIHGRLIMLLVLTLLRHGERKTLDSDTSNCNSVASCCNKCEAEQTVLPTTGTALSASKNEQTIPHAAIYK